MKQDEFAFFNQQLAKMVQSGIPLERGIQRLCVSMKSSRTKAELLALHQDLANGMPLVAALERRKLPEYFQAMVRVGVNSNNLCGVLNLLADYYSKTGSLWIRLKGLMVYPLLVLFLALALSFWTAYLGRHMSQQLRLHEMPEKGQTPSELAMNAGQLHSKNIWAPFFVIAIAAVGAGLCTGLPGLRHRMEWALPAFREARLAQFAHAMHLMLAGGCSLPSALALAARLEQSSRIGREIPVWQQRCADGHGKWSDIVSQSQSLPGLFRWLVSSPDEDPALGFKRAGEIYATRAAFQTEIMLYAAMPSVLFFLGIMILIQLYPFVSFIFGLFKMVSVFR